MIPLMIDAHIAAILLTGFAFLLMVVLPPLLKDRLLSVPMIYVAFGFILYSLPIDLPFLDPDSSRFDMKVLEYLTEFIVIISLSAIGIKIDNKPSWNSWKVGFYLIAIAMPITITLIAFSAYHLLGLGLASALLLGAAVAPTDPVLASTVQVGPPNMGDGHKVKFALTLEAGINDGLAFPFIFLALALNEYGLSTDTIVSWMGYEFLVKVLVGVLVGALMGIIISKFFLSYLTDLDDQYRSEVSIGIYMIAVTLLTYGVSEFFDGYGFLAVFVAAVMARQRNNDHPVHKEAYLSIDQVEQAVLGLFLIAFGSMLASGGLAGVTWIHFLIAMLIIFIIRPLSGMLSLLNCSLPMKERYLISFMGIRGIGTVYYLAFASNVLPEMPYMNDVWYTANVTIISSIVLHGIAAQIFIPQLEQ